MSASTVVVILIYFLPTLLACSNWHRSTFGIFLLNLFLGWTVVGWIAAGAWAESGSPSEDEDEDEGHAGRVRAVRHGSHRAAPLPWQSSYPNPWHPAHPRHRAMHSTSHRRHPPGR